MPTIKRNLPFIVFAGGTLIAALISVIALTFLNPPQCPANVSPHNNDCIIGANIGGGLYILLAAGIWIIAVFISVLLGIRNIFSDKSTSRITRAAQSLLFVLAAGLAAYLVLSVFLGQVSNFIRA